MRELGVNMILTGGETADVGDLVRTIIVDSTVTARIRKEDIIENNIKPGDVIVGLSSSGQASYEDEYNGGICSNILTSSRHYVFSKYIAKKYPESFDPSIPEDLIYSGNMKLTDKTEVDGVDAGKLVLAPTRTFAPIIKEILSKYRRQINGLIHCSGGAQTKVLHFVDNLHIIKDNLFETPPLFKLIKQQSGTEWKEMYKVFNMCQLIELYFPKNIAQDIIEISKSFNVDAQIVGKVELNNSKKLTIKSQYGEFVY